jgi:hypothetical protein
MKKDVADAISAALDQIISEYESNHHVIFESEAARKKLHYGAVGSWLAAWKKKRRCIRH